MNALVATSKGGCEKRGLNEEERKRKRESNR